MLQLTLLLQEFSVCKVKDLAEVCLADEFFFIGKTDQELSLVCETSSVPKNSLVVENGWKGFRVEGQLDFELVGILAKISTILADAEISIFAISTYDTDYILVKEDKLDEAITALTGAGYTLC